MLKNVETARHIPIIIATIQKTIEIVLLQFKTIILTKLYNKTLLITIIYIKIILVIFEKFIISKYFNTLKYYYNTILLNLPLSIYYTSLLFF